MSTELTLVIGAFIGFTIASYLSMSSIEQAHDDLVAVKLQYSDCRLLGTYPSKADMLPGDSNQ